MASPSSPRFTSYSCEKRPRLLKDFLRDDSAPTCSSNGGSLLLRRSRSKAATISISAIHKASEMVINAIKFLPFTSSSSSSMVNKSSHSILPRSISRKLSRNSRDHHKDDKSTASSPTITPKIKDILRWKSFRDVVEELSTSWYESDFTAEEDRRGENIDFMDPKKMEGQFPIDEDEQHSPVSVLDINSPFREGGESISFFSRSIDCMERRKCVLMKRIEEFETLAKVEIFNHEKAKESDDESNAVEAKARQLLSQVKATTSFHKKFDLAHEDRLLMDFFMHELAIAASKKQKDDVESADSDEMLALAKSWMNKKCYEGPFDWILLEKSESCVKDMEIGQRWDKFDEEQQELGNELEIDVLNDLFDELLADLVIQ